ncbi:MAG: 50S ribosomal protein L10 [Bacteroidetes bacterium]|nr:50S ribosomal protein L10 [Bacteroidota bacterium]
MTKSEKNQAIDSLLDVLTQNNIFYLADTSGMTVAQANGLRRLCFAKGISIQVVKNTLLTKAMEKSDKDFSEIYVALKGTTALMVSDTGNAPAKLIKEFSKKSDKLKLKGAYVESAVFLGADQLDNLVNIKSREELIGDIIGLLQSPAKNVIGALQGSAGQKIAGLVKALEDRAA